MPAQPNTRFVTWLRTYLTKPLDVKQFLRVVDKLLE